MPWDNIVTFPGSSANRAAKRRLAPSGGSASAIEPKNMHTFLFRSRDLILESDEADLVRDVCFDINKAQTKLKAIRRRLQGLQEYTAAQVQLLTAADTKLTAAIVAALLWTILISTSAMSPSSSGSVFSGIWMSRWSRSPPSCRMAVWCLRLPSATTRPGSIRPTASFSRSIRG